MKLTGIMPAVGLALCLSAVFFEVELAAREFDVVIKNGLIVDGSGTGAYRADVALEDGKIVTIEANINAGAARVIEAGGMVVAPGFIDIHTHQDGNIEDHPGSLNYLKMGVTSVLAGNCGVSPWPIGDYLDKVEEQGAAINFAMLAGHRAIYDSVMGRAEQYIRPDSRQMEEMKANMARAMEEGAFGLSAGLFYLPGKWTWTEEIVDLCEVVSDYGGFYAVHMRCEACHILQSVAETINIGRDAQLPVQISHWKITGERNWPLIEPMLFMVRHAREMGVDIAADIYPYDTSATAIENVFIPAWARDGGRELMLERLQDPENRAAIREHIIWLLDNIRAGPENTRVSSSRIKDYEGKTVAEICGMHGLEATSENAADKIIYLVETGRMGGLFTAMSQEVIDRLMREPYTMIAGDGFTREFGTGYSHPRNYGTNARVLSEYVRERGVLTLEDAVRKMTALPAGRMGLSDRGLIRPGMWADLVVFDPDTVTDRATFLDPHRYSEGFEYVLVNGKFAIDGGEPTGIRAGMVLRHGNQKGNYSRATADYY